MNEATIYVQAYCAALPVYGQNSSLRSPSDEGLIAVEEFHKHFPSTSDAGEWRHVVVDLRSRVEIVGRAREVTHYGRRAMELQELRPDGSYGLSQYPRECAIWSEREITLAQATEMVCPTRKVKCVACDLEFVIDASDPRWDDEEPVCEPCGINSCELIRCEACHAIEYHDKATDKGWTHTEDDCDLCQTCSESMLAEEQAAEKAEAEKAAAEAAQ